MAIPADVAWGGAPGGEYKDMSSEAISAAEADAYALLTAKAMANPARFDVTKPHKRSTVHTRMRLPHGHLLVDTLESTGFPAKGRGGDPNAEAPPATLHIKAPVLERPAPRLVPEDSITQQHMAAAAAAAAGVPEPVPAPAPLPLMPSLFAQRVMERVQEGGVTPMSADSGSVASGRGKGARHSAVDSVSGPDGVSGSSGSGADATSDSEGAGSSVSRARLRGRAARRRRTARRSSRRRDSKLRGSTMARPLLTGRESHATVLERSRGFVNPASRLHMARMEREVKTLRRRLRDLQAQDEDEGASRVSSHASVVERVDEAEQQLRQETRAQYLAYLQQEYHRGNCPAPDPTSTELELRNVLETLLFERDRRVGINRARVVAITGFYLIEIVLRFLRAPIRIEHLGIFMQKNLESGNLDVPLERWYKSKLQHLAWDSKWDLALALLPLVLGFMAAKYLGAGAGQEVLPGVPLPGDDAGAEGGVHRPADFSNNARGVVGMMGGAANMVGLFQSVMGLLGGGGGGGGGPPMPVSPGPRFPPTGQTARAPVGFAPGPSGATRRFAPMQQPPPARGPYGHGADAPPDPNQMRAAREAVRAADATARTARLPALARAPGRAPVMAHPPSSSEEED